MKQQNIKSSTILELLISMIILSILVIIFAAIELFSHTHVLTIDRRAKVQNDLAYIMEHSTKQIAKAIGNTQINSNEIIKISTIAGDDIAAIKFYVDVDSDGNRDDDAASPWRAYRLRSLSAPESERYQFWWCPSCSDSACATCSPAWGTLENILSDRVTGPETPFVHDAANNYVDITIQGCWDPKKVTTADDCGTSDRNPGTSLTARIKMPSVSTQ